MFNIGTKYNIDINITNQFQTMVSVIPGEESISFIFDFLNLSNNYKIYLNENDYNIKEIEVGKGKHSIKIELINNTIDTIDNNNELDSYYKDKKAKNYSLFRYRIIF